MLQESGAVFGAGYAQQWAKCNDKLLWGSVYPPLLVECGEVNLLLRVCRRPKVGLGLWEEPCGLAVPIHAAGIWCYVWRWICSAMETHMLSSLCLGPVCGKLWVSQSMLQESGAVFGVGFAQQWTKCNDKLLWGSVYPPLLMECGEVNLLLRVCRRPNVAKLEIVARTMWASSPNPCCRNLVLCLALDMLNNGDPHVK